MLTMSSLDINHEEAMWDNDIWQEEDFDSDAPMERRCEFCGKIGRGRFPAFRLHQHECRSSKRLRTCFFCGKEATCDLITFKNHQFRCPNNPNRVDSFPSLPMEPSSSTSSMTASSLILGQDTSPFSSSSTSLSSSSSSTSLSSPCVRDASQQQHPSTSNPSILPNSSSSPRLSSSRSPLSSPCFPQSSLPTQLHHSLTSSTPSTPSNSSTSSVQPTLERSSTHSLSSTSSTSFASEPVISEPFLRIRSRLLELNPGEMLSQTGISQRDFMILLTYQSDLFKKSTDHAKKRSRYWHYVCSNIELYQRNKRNRSEVSIGQTPQRKKQYKKEDVNKCPALRRLCAYFRIRCHT